MWTLGVTGQLADAMTTHAALGTGGREANPLMRKGIEAFGPAFVYAIKGAMVFRTFRAFRDEPATVQREHYPLSMTLLGWGPALNNLVMLRRAEVV